MDGRPGLPEPGPPCRREPASAIVGGLARPQAPHPPWGRAVAAPPGQPCRDPPTGGGGHEPRTGRKGGEGAQTRGAVRRAPDDGAGGGLSRLGALGDSPVGAEGHAIEDASGADPRGETRPGARLVVHPRPLRRPHVGGPEPCRGRPAGPGVAGHPRDRAAPGWRGAGAPRPVCEVTLTSGGHHRRRARAEQGAGEPHDPPRGSRLASRRAAHPTGACRQRETAGAQDRDKARRTRWGGTDPPRIARRGTRRFSTTQRVSPTEVWG